MNKSELVTRISEATRLPPAEVSAVVEAFIGTVTRSVMRGEKVVLSGFGTFHRRARGKRTARDIRGGRTITVKARNVPAFRPGKPFLEAVASRRWPATSRIKLTRTGLSRGRRTPRPLAPPSTRSPHR